MARKKQRSLLQQQREKLKAQKAAKAAKQAKAPKLPPGKKGGAIAKTTPSKGGALAKTTKGGSMVKSAGGSLAKAGKLAKFAKGAGAVGLVASGVSTAKDLGSSLKRGEGYASLPKLARKLASENSAANKGRTGRSGASRRPATAKPSTPTKKTTGQKTNRRGRVVGNAKPSAKVAPAKRGMSNIPPKEGTGKGSPNDKPKNTSAPKGSAPKSSAPKSSAPKASSKKSAIHTYKAHGSDLHVGRHKTLKEHRAAVAENKKKKK